VLAPNESRELFIAPEWPGRGPGPGGSPNAGAGAGGALLIERLLRNGEPEAVTDLHEGRRGGVARLAAGVRRANGGAILLSVDATEVANLQRQSSLDALLADIVHNTADIAYVVYEDADVRKAQGDLPTGESDRAATVHVETATGERQLDLRGRPILEVTGPIDIGGAQQGVLRLGMRLDRLRTAERRTAARLVVSLAAASGLGVLTIGLLWIRRRFGALSVEHALAQEALRRRDRLAAMGELSSTVAHEIRNPLNAIAMSAQRLRSECFDGLRVEDDDPDEARSLVDVIQNESQRINQKIQQFLEYARPPALQPQPVTLSLWVSAIVAALKPVADARHVLLSADLTDATTVIVDPDQMRQALDNILLNAIEATPEGGIVTVRATVSGSDIVIDVRDSGAGIDAEHLPRIFDLYFTTKRNGTGVGLAVTQQIVAGHGGTIEVESAPSRGTLMRIRVPVTKEAVNA
jgi:signal transduction histidine kinase